MRRALRLRVVLAAAAAASVVCLARVPLRACLWDSDTLAAEARGVPEAVRVITGRFERNPPLYYEMRLDRAYDRVKSDPDDLAAYDDAGVACDRLGRGDEAVEWVDRKRARLDAMGAAGKDVREHTYRALANLGTFEAHRWFRGGADRARIAEVESARDHIAAAIALNPQAHFGREPYQLKILEWVIKPPAYDPKNQYKIPTFLDLSDGPARKDAHAAVVGLTGLIALGNAWESVDVFNQLTLALEADGERTSVAFMAMWRARELATAGETSLVPGAPAGDDLAGRLAGPSERPRSEDELRGEYRALRAEADAWQASRTAYMTRRLERGSHPDTDPHFWDDFRDPGPPPLHAPAAKLARWHRRYGPESSGTRRILVTSGVALVTGLAVAAAVTRRRRWAGRKPLRGGGAGDLG